MAFALFITRNDIIKQTPLQGAIDSDKLLPFIRTSQTKYMENLLGTVLYNKLQSDITSGTPFTGAYQTLMEDYVKPTLIWYACVEYIPFSGTQFKSEGAVKYKSEQSETPPKNEIDYLAQKAQDNAEWYATRLQDWLLANSESVPEYYESTGDNTMIYPDQSNQYFGGLNL
jgi:hypothetical protein